MEQISLFLRELYGETRLDQLPKVILEGLTRLVPCENMGYNEIDAQTNRTLIEVKPNLPILMKLMPTLEAHFHEHPMLNYYRANSDRTPYQFTDFLSEREFRQLGIYREVYRHINADHQIACIISEPGESCDIGLAINRKAEFSNRDRAVITFLQPHLCQARKNAAAFAATQQLLNSVQAAADQFGAGFITVDANGRVLSATPLAIRLLERFFSGERKDSRTLPDPLSRWLAQCRSRLEGEISTEQPHTLFQSSLLPSSLKVRYAPDSANRGGRLLLAEEQDLGNMDWVRGLGLTIRESEVMRWVVEGKSNPEIALILGTSPRTIDKHTQHIFDKLGVSSRQAAVREVLLRRSL